MKGRHALTALLALSTIMAVGCDDDDDDVVNPPANDTFTASLTGAAERPTPSTSPATGAATFTSSTSGSTTTITYQVVVTGNLTGPVTAAHIHGPADATGTANPIVTLTVSGTGTTGTVVSGSFTTTGTSTTMEQLIALMKAGQTYVNLHTTANPNGEIRGQIID
jgi:hypothetical protein